ncbi:MAG: nucleotidyl transferase AbiEii/AbiGii toxin family protein [Magnetococcales bacterium]|nr:nucleotidyl transferase AbiEii/AbiGii toxin family protein [Magnetococcales bacterium]
MPLTPLQRDVLRVLAAQRTPESYVAGGVALNRTGPRYSEDIDIFQDSEAACAAAAEADHAALIRAGLTVIWQQQRAGRRQALIQGVNAIMRLDWVADSDFRFFPAQPDPLFGYVLHPIDLATNKAAAAADRRVPRDIVDLVTIHERILPLGAVVCAAVGRFPGQSPEGMLADMVRHSRFTAEEFRVLAMESPVDVPELHRRIRRMIDEAAGFIERIPSEYIGFVFLENDQPVQPDLGTLERYRLCSGSRHGIWPSSAEISQAMLERYVSI